MVVLGEQPHLIANPPVSPKRFVSRFFRTVSNLSTLRANDLIYINWALAKDVTLLKLGQRLSLGMLTLLPAIADLDVGTLYAQAMRRAASSWRSSPACAAKA